MTQKGQPYPVLRPGCQTEVRATGFYTFWNWVAAEIQLSPAYLELSQNGSGEFCPSIIIIIK